MSTRVHITELRLTGWRNHVSASLHFDARHVALVGDNGAGKTNLIEAISLLTPGRGLRRAAYGDMVHVAPGALPASGFSIFARVEGMAGPVALGTGIEPGETGARKVRINGAPARSADEMLEHLRLLWLTPAMDGLFTGPAGDRRRFLDRLVLTIDPAHGARALDYERAMRSRNRLLSEGRPDPAWLDGIEAQMAELGVALALARRDVTGMLAALIENQGQEGAFPAARLGLEGFLDNADGTADALEAQFARLLREGRMRDAAAGRTLVGPHRADLTVFHREKDMPASLSSTGEQKALLIGLILAHARLVKSLTGHAPVLLLDEIAAHLDEGRRASLFTLIEDIDGQAFMTGTDANLFSALGARGALYSVSGGKVVRETPQNTGDAA